MGKPFIIKSGASPATPRAYGGPEIEQAEQTLAAVEPFTAPEIEQALRGLAERLELKPRKAFGPIRAAVTGSVVSPPLPESLALLGRDRTVRRLRLAWWAGLFLLLNGVAILLVRGDPWWVAAGYLAVAPSTFHRRAR